jgi:nicotinate-nucleotide pyrophosphorylase (carboxylating)
MTHNGITLALQNELTSVITTALSEDGHNNDITTLSTLANNESITAAIILKQRGVIAGIDLLPHLLSSINKYVTVDLLAHDGNIYDKKTTLSYLHGPAFAILSIERVLLNLLQHLSGIATKVRSYIDIMHPYPCDLLDTRKTIPCLRYSQKYAVTMGGGINHRFNLSDKILIKNNHIYLLTRTTKSPYHHAIMSSKSFYPNIPIEIEVPSYDVLDEVLITPPTAILLDNMSVEEVLLCVKKINKRSYVEASGNITDANIRSYAATGVDGISVGSLTHSAPSLDICLHIQ